MHGGNDPVISSTYVGCRGVFDVAPSSFEGAAIKALMCKIVSSKPSLDVDAFLKHMHEKFCMDEHRYKKTGMFKSDDEIKSLVYTTYTALFEQCMTEILASQVVPFNFVPLIDLDSKTWVNGPGDDFLSKIKDCLVRAYLMLACNNKSLDSTLYRQVTPDGFFLKAKCSRYMVTEECRQFMQAIDLVQTEAGKRLIDHETEVIVAVRKLFLYKAFKNKRELAQELKQFSGMSGCVNLGRLVPRIRNLLNKYTPMEINEHIALIQVYISEAQRISSSSVMNIGNY